MGIGLWSGGGDFPTVSHVVMSGKPYKKVVVGSETTFIPIIKEGKMTDKNIEMLDANIAMAMRKMCFTGDGEGDHLRADDFLVDLLQKVGCEKTAATFCDVEKMYA
jgi:hypothetical protein